MYEVIERRGWREEAGSRPNIEVSDVILLSPQSYVQVFILRIFMWLSVGTISGSWVWSGKSLAVWRNLGTRSGTVLLVLPISPGASVSGLEPRRPPPRCSPRWLTTPSWTRAGRRAAWAAVGGGSSWAPRETLTGSCSKDSSLT